MIDAVLAALVVQRKEREPLGAGREQPAQATFDPGAGLIKVRYGRGDQLAVNLVQEWPQVARALGDVGGERPGRDRRAKPVLEQLSGAFVGQMLAGDQIDRQRPHPRPVLRRRRHASREAGGRPVPANAAASLGEMLDNPQADLGQIKHLPPLAALDRSARQIGTTALANAPGNA